MDFRLSGWPRDDFRFGIRYSDYRPEAKPETIDKIIIEKAKEWLEKNRN